MLTSLCHYLAPFQIYGRFFCPEIGLQFFNTRRADGLTDRRGGRRVEQKYRLVEFSRSFSQSAYGHRVKQCYDNKVWSYLK